MKEPSVELTGEFEPDEAAYLRATFDHCGIELLARSSRDPSIVLLRWTSAPAGAGLAVTDARRMPFAAVYVLERPRADFQLTPIRSWDELHELYPEHFDEVDPAVAPELTPSRGRGCLPLPFERRLTR